MSVDTAVARRRRRLAESPERLSVQQRHGILHEVVRYVRPVLHFARHPVTRTRVRSRKPFLACHDVLEAFQTVLFERRERRRHTRRRRGVLRGIGNDTEAARDVPYQEEERVRVRRCDGPPQRQESCSRRNAPPPDILHEDYRRIPRRPAFRIVASRNELLRALEELTKAKWRDDESGDSVESTAKV